MFCNKCGTQNSEGTNFCISCGNKLEEKNFEEVINTTYGSEDNNYKKPKNKKKLLFLVAAVVAVIVAFTVVCFAHPVANNWVKKTFMSDEDYAKSRNRYGQ